MKEPDLRDYAPTVEEIDVALAQMLLLVAVGSIALLAGVFQAYEGARDPFGRADGICQGRVPLSGSEGDFHVCLQWELRRSPLSDSRVSFAVAGLVIAAGLVGDALARRNPRFLAAWKHVRDGRALRGYLLGFAMFGLASWTLVMAAGWRHPGDRIVLIAGFVAWASLGVASTRRRCRGEYGWKPGQ